MRSLFGRAGPSPRPAPDPLWFRPETDGPNPVERELLAKLPPWVPPPPTVEVVLSRGRLVLLRVDQTFMGLPIWTEEPVIFPGEIDDPTLGETIERELDSRRTGRPSPTGRGWSAWNKEMAARLGVRSLKSLDERSPWAWVVRDADGFVITPRDTRPESTDANVAEQEVRTVGIDAAELGAGVREALNRARCAPAIERDRSARSRPHR